MFQMMSLFYCGKQFFSPNYSLQAFKPFQENFRDCGVYYPFLTLSRLESVFQAINYNLLA